MIKHLLLTALLMIVSAVSSFAQSDWNTYPDRSIANLIQAHSGEASKKADVIISADPFPSKTVATYTGKHRPVSEYEKSFINLWMQSRNLPPENATMLVEEYLFKENGKEYWIPVHKQLPPFFDRELKEGDEIAIYYFFMGGYNEGKLRKKNARGNKTKEESKEIAQDKFTWIFAVEEFHK